MNRLYLQIFIWDVIDVDLWYSFRLQLLEVRATRAFPRCQMHRCACWRVHHRSWTCYCWNKVGRFKTTPFQKQLKTHIWSQISHFQLQANYTWWIKVVHVPSAACAGRSYGVSSLNFLWQIKRQQYVRVNKVDCGLKLHCETFSSFELSRLSAESCEVLGTSSYVTTVVLIKNGMRYFVEYLESGEWSEEVIIIYERVSGKHFFFAEHRTVLPRFAAIRDQGNYIRHAVISRMKYVYI